MSLGGHDMRLLSAACVAWAALATLLSARPDPAIVVVVLALVTIVAAALAFGTRLPGLRADQSARARHEGEDDENPASSHGSGWALWALLVIALTTIVLAAAQVTLAHEEAGPVTTLARDRAVATLEARVTGQPHRVVGARGDERFVVPAQIDRITARGRTQEVATPVILVGDRRWTNLTWQSHLRARGRLAPSQRLGAARAVVQVNGAPDVVGAPPWVVTTLEPVRAGLVGASSQLPDDPAGLLPALVVGDTAHLPDDLTDAMNATGMSHLNAVSGSNVTVVLVATMWLLGWSRTSRRVRVALALVALAAYVVLCRPEPSVVRAAAMGAVGVLGTSWGRERAACPALAAAIVGLLVWDPWLAVSVGFALSALATLGLVLFARRWSQALLTKLGSRRDRFVDGMVEITCVPLAAQALCLPVLVALNSSVSWVSIPANVAAEPFVAPATLGGMIVSTVAVIAPTLAGWLVWLPGLPTWVICAVARLADAVPGGSVPWLPGLAGVVLAIVVVAVLLCAWRAIVFTGRFGLVALGVAGALLAAVLAPLPGESAAPPAWVYAQCAVGQGDAALVRTGATRAVMIDVGPADGHPAQCLERHGITTLDAVILTHFHADHVGGLAEVLRASDAPVAVLGTWVMEGAQESEGLKGRGAAASSRSRGEQGALGSVQAALEQPRASLGALAPGQRLVIGKVTIEVLWPRRVMTEGSVQNNASLVLDVSAPAYHALMLGDCEREAQAAVIEQVRQSARRRAFDLVKVAHHGSSNQNERLYEAAAARQAVIGVGAGNDYGHPTKKTLELLARHDARVWRTDTQGDVDALATGGSISLQAQR